MLLVGNTPYLSGASPRSIVGGTRVDAAWSTRCRLRPSPAFTAGRRSPKRDEASRFASHHHLYKRRWQFPNLLCAKKWTHELVTEESAKKGLLRVF
jgi:hypothetical protein